MATTRKRVLPSGKIKWQCDYRDGSGKRRARQFSTKREADRFLLKVGSEVAQGIHVPDATAITVAEAAALWLKRGEREELEEATLNAYEQHVRLHITPLIGAAKLSRTNTPTIEAFKDELLATRSRSMTKRVMTSLSSIFTEAQRRGLASQNPVLPVSVRTPKRIIERPARPTTKELAQLLEAVKGRWRPIIWTAIFTGLRGSELRGLCWRDVDLKANEIEVRQRVDFRNRFGAPKSEAGTRRIPLAPSLASLLREWKLACPIGEFDLVFPNGSGNVENHANIVKRGFVPLQLSCGISKLADGEPKAKYGLHALRHAAAALFIEQGFKPKRVQALMGHSSIQVTFDLYGYLFPSDEEDKAAMKAIEMRLIGEQ